MTLLAENNPILLDENIPHFYKIIILRWGLYYVQKNGLKDVKSYQNAFSSVFKNSDGSIGTDELMALYASGSKDEVWDFDVQSYGRMFKGNEFSTNELYSKLDTYKIQIDDYCEFLLENNKSNVCPNAFNKNQIRKIEQICNVMGIEHNENVDT
ncbi:6685_t:CDS:1, partial [Acaulospora colombiana]